MTSSYEHHITFTNLILTNTTILKKELKEHKSEEFYSKNYILPYNQKPNMSNLKYTVPPCCYTVTKYMSIIKNNKGLYLLSLQTMSNF